jgi:hypothetical protein
MFFLSLSQGEGKTGEGEGKEQKAIRQDATGKARVQSSEQSELIILAVQSMPL